MAAGCFFKVTLPLINKYICYSSLHGGNFVLCESSTFDDSRSGMTHQNGVLSPSLFMIELNIGLTRLIAQAWSFNEIVSLEGKYICKRCRFHLMCDLTPGNFSFINCDILLEFFF